MGLGQWAWANGPGPMGLGQWAWANGPGPMGPGLCARAYGQGQGPRPMRLGLWAVFRFFVFNGVDKRKKENGVGFVQHVLKQKNIPNG